MKDKHNFRAICLFSNTWQLLQASHSRRDNGIKGVIVINRDQRIVLCFRKVQNDCRKLHCSIVRVCLSAARHRCNAQTFTRIQISAECIQTVPYRFYNDVAQIGTYRCLNTMFVVYSKENFLQLDWLYLFLNIAKKKHLTLCHWMHIRCSYY